MTMWKKLTAGAAGIVMMASMAACGGGSNASSASDPTSQSSTTSDSSSSNGSKTLVAYYSATGNTEKVAKEIAAKTGADSFVIEPVDAYSEEDLNWNDTSSRIDREYDNKDLRDIKLKTTKVPNWDTYTTVYLGYPIWWSIAAWPIDNFVKDNDFSGKTVIPFCTSMSSPIGSSATDLEKLTNTGDWKEGQRFSEDASTQEVDEWVDSR